MDKVFHIGRRTLPVFISCLSLLSSCSVEKKLGKEYLAQRSDTSMLLLMPDFIFRYNLKTYEFPGLDSLPQWQQDSILIAGSRYLKAMTDSAVVNVFRNSFTERLGLYGISVFDEPSLDSFLIHHGSGIMVNVAQISLEEYIHPYSFDYYLFDEPYSVSDIDLNAISMNIWIELSRLNSEQKNKVLFASDFISDSLDGYFRQYLFSGDIQFEYTVDSLTVPQVQAFIAKMGGRCADYLADYLLNDYIQRNIPAGYPADPKPLHWNPVKRIFVFIPADDKFLEVTPEKK